MKISKQIMNPTRIKILEFIKNNNETNSMYIANILALKFNSVNLSISRFAELGLIKFTGGGYFKISEKGNNYLNCSQ